jgi:hypothetical protein
VAEAFPEDALAPHGVACSLDRELPVRVEAAFDTVVAQDVLPYVLHRVGPVPAVAGTRELTGPWDTPGSTRTVELDNGQTVRETVTVWLRPVRFEYRVDGFGPPLGWLVDHAIGSWLFEPAGRTSRFRWTYTFVPRHWWVRPLLFAFVRLFWRRYMEACADRLVQRATGS